jgi:hypothetical protein
MASLFVDGSEYVIQVWLDAGASVWAYMCDPQILLLLPLLPRPHRHAPILQTTLCIPQNLLLTNQGLHHGLLVAPRAARH